MKGPVPWALVGFVAGAVVGFMYGGNVAERGLSDAITTTWRDRKVVVEFDPAKALAAGL